MDNDLEDIEHRLMRLEEAAIAVTTAMALTIARYEMAEQQMSQAYVAIKAARKEADTRRHEVTGLTAIAQQLQRDFDAIKARRAQS
jgi:hypothetical protein